MQQADYDPVELRMSGVLDKVVYDRDGRMFPAFKLRKDTKNSNEEEIS